MDFDAYWKTVDPDDSESAESKRFAQAGWDARACSNADVILEYTKYCVDLAVAAVRERCALICESHIDAKEQACASLNAAKALNEGSMRDQIDRLSHEGVVHLYNRTLQKCADEIRKA